MAKLKVKDLEYEGEPAEINSFIKDNDVNLKEYFNSDSSNKKLSSTLLIIFAIIFFALCCFEYNNILQDKNLRNIETLAIFLTLGISVFFVHQKYNNGIATFVAGLFGVLIILIAFGVYTPQEAAKDLRKNIPGTNKEKEN